MKLTTTGTVDMQAVFLRAIRSWMTGYGLVVMVALGLSSCPSPGHAQCLGGPSVCGQWGSRLCFPSGGTIGGIKGIANIVVMRSGKVLLVYETGGSHVRRYDPQTGSLTGVHFSPDAQQFFCSAHAQLADGRIPWLPAPLVFSLVTLHRQEGSTQRSRRLRMGRCWQLARN